MTQYIGISGETTRAQIEAILDGYPEHGPKLALGILTSWKHLRGIHDISHPKRYPLDASSIRNLMTDDPRCLSIVHYSVKEEQVADEGELASDLSYFNIVRASMLQLNTRPMPWPTVHDELHLRKLVFTRAPPLILQLREPAIKALVDDADHLTTSSVRTAVLWAEHCLLDPSGGEGKMINANWLIDTGAIQWLMGDYARGIGVAGGLTPDNLHQLDPLMKLCPYLSIDTESGVRTPNDELDIGKARAFWQAGLELISAKP